MDKDPELSDSFIGKVADKVEVTVEEKIKLESPRHRTVENVLAYAGAFQATIVGTLEALRHYGVLKAANCEPAEGLPWFSVIALVVLVAPKTLGRATLGKYLDRLPVIGGKSG